MRVGSGNGQEGRLAAIDPAMHRLQKPVVLLPAAVPDIKRDGSPEDAATLRAV